MKVYHGSCVEVAKPDIIHSRKKVDFGVGFYVTPIEEQAKNWCKQYIFSGVANDKVFDTVELYLEKIISKKDAIGRLAFEKPNFQICLRTQNVIDEYLVFERSYSI